MFRTAFLIMLISLICLTGCEDDKRIVRPELTGPLTISTDKYYIFADYGLGSYATITAVLTDSLDEPMSGKEIYFEKSFSNCSIEHHVMTDSQGRAVTILDDRGHRSEDLYGNPAEVIVTAHYRPLELSTSVGIMIIDLPPITSVDLVVNPNQMSTNDDSALVSATINTSNNATFPDGMFIRFWAIYGHFTEAEKMIMGNTSLVKTYYSSSRIGRTDTIRASIYSSLGLIQSDPVAITITSEPPDQIELRTNPSYTSVNSNEEVKITADVLDDRGNPVAADTLVIFTCSTGEVERIARTDFRGRATVNYLPGITAGYAIITATVQGPIDNIQESCSLRVSSGPPHSITLESDPDRIPTSSNVEVNSSTLSAALRDSYGNLVTRSTPVYFGLMDAPPPPTGPKYKDNYDPEFRTLSRSGIATAELISGSALLSVRHYAYTFRDEDHRDTIRAFDTVEIFRSMSRVGININENGYDVGSGYWELDVACFATDHEGNPAPDGTPINLIYEREPHIEYDLILNPALVGNENRNGETLPGTAFTTLTYHSLDSYKNIWLVIIQGELNDGLEARILFKLPLQQGELSLTAEPVEWFFNDPETPSNIRIQAVLTDGQDYHINGVPVLFSSNRPFFYWKDNTNSYVPFFPDPAVWDTGLSDGVNCIEDGTATIYLRADEQEIFEEILENRNNVVINAILEDDVTVTAQPVEVLFRR